MGLVTESRMGKGNTMRNFPEEKNVWKRRVRSKLNHFKCTPYESL
jgi:hypothetical protein